jgi:hypothetical protein
VPNGRKRETANDYEAFLTDLCGMPPGSERDECLCTLATELLTMYVNYGLTIPPGLLELAQRIGATAPLRVR